MRCYVHGAGRSGVEAWPVQRDECAVFVDHATAVHVADKAQLVVDQAPPAPTVVVAHSLGAVATELATRRDMLHAGCVVLIEPALYDIARGNEAIESHIAPMTQARDRANHQDLYGYWQIVAPLLFGRAAARETWDEDRPLAQRFAAQEPPWGHGADADTFRHTSTLVVTGDWNDEYEMIASRLTEAGARHVHLTGFQHRPQDHPNFGSLVHDFASQGDLTGRT